MAKNDFIDDKPEKPEENRLHPVLTNEQFEAAKKAAREKLEKERVAAAREAVEKEELARLRFEEGLVVGGVSDEIVQITLDLAPFQPNIVINSRPYWHGQTYTVPRHVADTLRETMYRGWEYENREIDGKSMKEFYAKKRLTDMWAVKGGGTIVSRNSLLSSAARN